MYSSKIKRPIFGNLTVAENLKLATFARKNRTAVNRDYDRVYGLFPQLARRRKQRSETLGGGEQQMLTVGRAIMTGCDFLLLDEPSMGLAPVLMMEMFQALGELNRDGMTILLIEQNAAVALTFAHRGYVLDAAGSRPRVRPRPCATTPGSKRPTSADKQAPRNRLSPPRLTDSLPAPVKLVPPFGNCPAECRPKTPSICGARIILTLKAGLVMNKIITEKTTSQPWINHGTWLRPQPARCLAGSPDLHQPLPHGHRYRRRHLRGFLEAVLLGGIFPPYSIKGKK